MLDQIKTVDKTRIIKRIDKLSQQEICNVKQ
ncbi:MAG: type II toxin-antitoxin system PemK/MazF family toxin [Cyclobacteriaceae bacterium]